MLSTLRRGLLIGNEEVFTNKEIEVVNPATHETIGISSQASLIEVDRAVDLAVSAQKKWSTSDLSERRDKLSEIAKLIKDSELELARILTIEQGKPLKDSRKEVDFASQVFGYYAENLHLLKTEHRASKSIDIQSQVLHPPLGVVAGIIPWNYPVDLWAWKVAPALAAGNAIIMKPPLETPLSPGFLARLVAEAGIPTGLLADLPGGVEVGIALSSHSTIRGISATCSTPTGISILRNSVETLKRVTLELGGNCPFIVMDDSNIQLAAAAAARRSFSNAGQICIAVNRIIVNSRIADTFVEALVDIVDNMAVGDGILDDSVMGPVTTSSVKKKTNEHVADALSRGGKRVTKRLEVLDSNLTSSNFLPPTVIDNISSLSKLATEETFGPAVGILRVNSTEEAIREANNSPFGLAAYVFTSDVEKGAKVAEELDFGGIGININDITELDAPFGGWKMSGIGRELGPEGLLAMTESKHVRTRLL